MPPRLLLFDAPFAHASYYGGPGTCSLCAEFRTDTLTFADAEEGDVEVTVECSGCRSPVSLCPRDPSAQSCWHCAAKTGPLTPVEAPRACFVCVADSRVTFAHNSEAGAWHPDGSGRDEMRCSMAQDPNHGGGGPPPAGRRVHTNHRRETEKQRRKALRAAALAALDDELVVSPKERRLLAVTPRIAFWQREETWLVCCNAFMVYVGSWTSSDFSAHAADEDARTYFGRVVFDAHNFAWNPRAPNLELAKVFRCRCCDKFRGMLDLPP